MDVPRWASDDLRGRRLAAQRITVGLGKTAHQVPRADGVGRALVPP
jgi:hypothetical protein